MIERRTKQKPLVVAALALVFASAPSSSRAQAIGEDLPAGRPLNQALWETVRSGKPTIAVVTSGTSAESMRLWESIERSRFARDLVGSYQFSEMPREVYADETARLNLSNAPTVLIYRKTGTSVSLSGRLNHPKEAADVFRWLMSGGSDAASTGMKDVAVRQAGGHRPVSATGQAQPSPQLPVSPPRQSPPSAPALPPVQTAPPAASFPVQPVSSPPVVVSSPSPTVVFQPQPMNVMIGPTPPPTISFVQSPASTPNVNVITPAASAPAPNLMFAPPAVQPQPAMGYPLPAPVAQPVAGVPLMAAQPAYAAAPTSSLGIVLNNPGPFDRLLAGFGQRLIRRGYPRIQMAPPAPAAFPIATVQPATPVMMIPQAQPVSPAQPYCPSPSVDVPSPQGGNAAATTAAPAHSRHHFFRLFGG